MRHFFFTLEVSSILTFAQNQKVNFFLEYDGPAGMPSLAEVKELFEQEHGEACLHFCILWFKEFYRQDEFHAFQGFNIEGEGTFG